MIQKILSALAGRANLLIRTKVTTPFQAITSDISEIKFKGGRAYLCIHKDIFGQMVYGWSLGLTMETKLTMASLKMAINKVRKLWPPKKGKLKNKPLLHQDRGSHGQESFFGRFKDEWRDEIAEIETFETLEKFVKKKIKYYNYERRHTSIGLVSPWNFTKSFLKKQPLMVR